MWVFGQTVSDARLSVLQKLSIFRALSMLYPHVFCEFVKQMMMMMMTTTTTTLMMI